MSASLRRVAGACCFCLVATGTLSATASAQTTTAAPTTSDASRAPAETQPALVEFARELERAVNERDAEGIDAAFSREALFNRTLYRIGATRSQQVSMKQGLAQSFKWSDALITGLGENGHYRFLRSHTVDGETRVLFRIINNLGGLNYHDVIVEPSGDTFVAVDAYVLMTGETLSASLRRPLSQMLAGHGATPATATAMVRMGTLYNQGRFAEALETYDELPESAQREKNVMILRVVCAAQVSQEAIDEATEDYRRAFPGDAGVDLVTFDQLILAERWGDAMQALKRVSEIVGPDAYLENLAAIVLLRSERLEAATKVARQAIRREPTLEAAHWTLVEIALEGKDHDTVAATLTTLEDSFGYEFEDLSGAEGYAEFVRSPQYQTWLASQDSPALPD